MNEPAPAPTPPPKPPVGLGRHGRALWKSITAAYELRPDELEALAVAARTLEELKAMERAAAGAATLVRGPRARQVPNPMLEELRRHRATYLRALRAVGIGEADRADVKDPRARSAAGRALVRQRWANRGG
ncbi:MAG: hypothetical protein IT295_10275 [Dehalococcoidia bacterium]|nr:hypothetical protein [Dehalococcoidia bacterium]